MYSEIAYHLNKTTNKYSELNLFQLISNAFQLSFKLTVTIFDLKPSENAYE